MELLEWFYVVALLLIMACLVFIPIFLCIYEILSPTINRIVAWFNRPNAQQIKEEEARRLEYERERKRLSDEFIEKRTRKRKQKIQSMLADGNLGKLNKTVDEILRASEEIMASRWWAGRTMLDMLGEGVGWKKSVNWKRATDYLIFEEVSMESGIDAGLLKRIVNNLEDLERAE